MVLTAFQLMVKPRDSKVHSEVRSTLSRNCTERSLFLFCDWVGG